MPNLRVAKNVIVVGQLNRNTQHTFHVFPTGGSSQRPNASYAAFVNHFDIFDPALGKLDEGNLFFQSWSPVPGDDRDDPENRGLVGEPRPEAKKLLDLLPKHLDTLARAAHEFHRIYDERMRRAVGRPPSYSDAFASHLGIRDPEVQSLQATFPPDPIASQAYRHLSDAMQEGSLVRPLLQHEVICQALEAACSYWISPRAKIGSGDDDPLGAGAKEAWDQASFDGLSDQQKFAWLYTLLTRSNHMEGVTPTIQKKALTPVEFRAEIARYSRECECVLPGGAKGTKYVVELPVQTMQEPQFDVEKAIQQLTDLTTARHRLVSNNPDAELPSAIVAYIDGYVRGFAGISRVDDLYAVELLRYAWAEMYDVTSGAIDQNAQQGAADGKQDRSAPGVDPSKVKDYALPHIDQQQAALAADPDRNDALKLSNQAASGMLVYLGKADPDSAAAEARRRLVSCREEATTGTAVELLNDKAPNLSFLGLAHDGATELRKRIGTKKTGQTGGGQAKTSTALTLKKGILDADPGNSKQIGKYLELGDEPRPVKKMAVWSAKAQALSADYRAPSLLDPPAPSAGPSKQAVACRALRLLYFGLLWFHEKVDASAESLAVLGDLLRAGGMRQLLRTNRLDKYVTFQTRDELVAAYQKAKTIYDKERQRTSATLSFCYGLRELFRSAPAQARIGVFLGSDEEFVSFYVKEGRFNPAGVNDPEIDIPSALFIHKTARSGYQFPVDGIGQVLGFPDRPLPPIILEALPAIRNETGAIELPANPLFSPSYVHYAGPGLRARGKCDGFDGSPSVPAGFLVLAAIVGGNKIRPIVSAHYPPDELFGGTDVRFLFHPRASDQRDQDWVSYAKSLLGWNAQRYDPKNKPIRLDPPYLGVMAVWYSVVSRVLNATWLPAVPNAITKWPFGADLWPAWGALGNPNHFLEITVGPPISAQVKYGPKPDAVDAEQTQRLNELARPLIK